MVSIILWNTFMFFEAFKAQEKTKMELLSEAYDQLNKATPGTDIGLMVKIIENNNTIPMMVTDQQGNILLDQNFDYDEAHKKQVLTNALTELKKIQKPIVINLNDHQKQYIYYANSSLLEQLKVYPYYLVIIFITFLWIIYAVLNNANSAQRNKLWSGMAKETAHQIGTPLSSLMGWVEILKAENVNPAYITEIEKDIEHLNIIAKRFSKIGSVPEKKEENTALVIQETLNYFKKRSSKNVDFSFEDRTQSHSILMNKDLFVWVLENLIKNAIDAMAGKGAIHISLEETPQLICLIITDSGKGLLKKDFHKIFEPGYTTKTRGWGLGLSLTRRIVEDYHNGKIFVKNSQKNLGTSFQINLPKSLK